MPTLTDSSSRASGSNHDYERVARALTYLREHFREQPSLDAAAAHVHLSPHHFQRLFTRWAGVSPKRFVQFLTLEYAKARLRAQRQDVLGASLDSGLSSPGRLHDLFVTVEAMSPGEFKRGGAGLTIGYGRHQTRFGPALIAATTRGVCSLSFLDDESDERNAIADLHARWPAASLRADPTGTAGYAQRLSSSQRREAEPLPVLLAGTPFQLKVWQALLAIAPGVVATYDTVADGIGQPGSARAVGGAVARNVVAYLIPCHRVIRASGEWGDYRWGATRKQAMIGWEAARAGQSPST